MGEEHELEWSKVRKVLMMRKKEMELDNSIQPSDPMDGWTMLIVLGYLLWPILLILILIILLLLF